MLEGDRLFVTDWARERARAIVLEPLVPWVAQPLLETVNFITIALLPDRIRREYGVSPLPPAGCAGRWCGRRRVRQAGGGALPARPAAAGAVGARCRLGGRRRTTFAVFVLASPVGGVTVMRSSTPRRSWRLSARRAAAS